MLLTSVMGALWDAVGRVTAWGQAGRGAESGAAGPAQQEGVGQKARGGGGAGMSGQKLGGEKEHDSPRVLGCSPAVSELVSEFLSWHCGRADHTGCWERKGEGTERPTPLCRSLGSGGGGCTALRGREHFQGRPGGAQRAAAAGGEVGWGRGVGLLAWPSVSTRVQGCRGHRGHARGRLAGAGGGGWGVSQTPAPGHHVPPRGF